MANVESLKQLIKASRNSNVPLWIWGPAGIGKSSVVKEAAKELDIDVIDIRCALLEPGDLTGLPVESIINEQKVVQFLTSEFLPKDPNWKGFIFLDEINRGSVPVMNAVFQLVLDRKLLNHYTLPVGATIIAAGNPQGSDDADYQVTSLDDALAKRFCHINFIPSKTDFFKYAEKTNVRSDLVSFLEKNTSVLDFSTENVLISSIKPSWRTVDFLSQIADSIEALGMDPLHTNSLIDEAARGLMGATYALQYSTHRKENIKKIDITKVLADYKTEQKKVRQFVKKGDLAVQRQAFKDLKDLITEQNSDIIKATTKEESSDNLVTFMLDISSDVLHAVFADFFKLENLVDITSHLKKSKDTKKIKLGSDLADKLMDLGKK